VVSDLARLRLPPLAFGNVRRQIARHENRHGELHYLLDYLLLTLVGGAVFFILLSSVPPKSPLPARHNR
jgi:hypothetical protein